MPTRSRRSSSTKTAPSARRTGKISRRLAAILWLSTIPQSWSQAETPKDDYASFTQQLESLKSDFHVPGVAVEVVNGVDSKSSRILFQAYLGDQDVESGQAVTAETLFPLASLTKVYSAVLLADLAEEGRLGLTDPVTRWLPASGLNDNVQVQHLLSHTSQGIPGERFYYSFRFGLLTAVAQKVGGKPFGELLRERVLQPLGLSDTYLYQPGTLSEPVRKRLATPHGFDGRSEAMDHEFGVSASAGLVATPRDVIRFGQALLRNDLLTGRSWARLTSAYKPGLPYGLGIFVQEVAGHQILWAYGQYDGFAGLWVIVPARQLQMIALANNNLLSDAARLINGDVSGSPLMLAFLETFLSEPGHVLPSETQRAKADLMTSVFLARFDEVHFEAAQDALALLLPTRSDWEERGDLNVMHAVMFLKTVAFHRELRLRENWDSELESLGKRLLAEQPDNPYAHYYLAELYAAADKPALAAGHYRAIVDAENFSTHWYTREAQSWLASHPNR